MSSPNHRSDLSIENAANQDRAALSGAPQLAVGLSDLFPKQHSPSRLACAEIRSPASAEGLFASEQRLIAHCAPRRIHEFAGGRACARLAMHQIGYTETPLLIQADRRPQWPAALVGSITHTDEYCAAVVAHKECYSSVGLDAEWIDRVSPELWDIICTPRELQWLKAQPSGDAQCLAALVFSAKEAFYKCQFNLTQQWLEFTDIELDFADWDWTLRSFTIRPVKLLALSTHISAPWTGRFVVYSSDQSFDKLRINSPGKFAHHLQPTSAINPPDRLLLVTGMAFT